MKGKVFLIGDHGMKTAFKITTARVVSSLDYLFDEAIEEFKTERLWNDYDDYTVILGTLTLWSGNIYFCTIDDLDSSAKKLTEKLIKPVVKEYVERNKDKFQEAIRIRRLNKKKYDEESN